MTLTTPRPEGPLPRARMLSVEQVADRWGVSRMTVYRLIHSCELRAYKIGRSFRVHPADADEYLRLSEIGGES